MKPLKKELLAVLIAFAIAIPAAISFSRVMARKQIDVSAQPDYAPMIGRRFLAKRELVVFKFDDSEDVELDVPGNGTPELKDMPHKFPFDYYGHQILGVLPAGTVFRITKAIREKSFENDYVHYRAMLEKSGRFSSVEVDPTWLTKGGRIPEFNLSLVEEVKNN